MPPKTLQFTETLSLPLDAATQTFAFIGRRGSGKSYAAGKLTELFLEAGIQVIILDLVGNWHGLRLSADGKGDGFDIPILGGLRGDIPLNAAAGELVADILCDTGRSAIVDLSQFSLADRKRFATAFATKLWARKKAERDPTPVFLFIEESHLIVPQNVKGDDARMVGIFEEIIRLGRNFGIGAGLIDQRPQSVNKDVLNQTECVLAFQLNGTHERRAMRDWIASKGLDVNLVDELPHLAVGEPYLWSPQWLKHLGQVRIAAKKTFDSTATPKVGQKRVQRELKPLDLAALEERMGALIEEKKGNDPRELKKRIAELERKLAARPAEVKIETKTEYVDKPVLTDDHLARLHQAVDMIRDDASRLLGIAEAISGGLKAVVDARSSDYTGARASHSRQMGTESRRNLITTDSPKATAPAHGIQRQTKSTVASNPAKSVHRSDGVTAPQQRILDALASFEALGILDVARSNVAVFSDQSSTSSGFANNLGALRTSGLVDYPAGGRVCLTDSGREVAEVTTPISRVSELHAAWFAKLTAPQGRILGVLIDRYPAALDRDELAERSAQSPTSSGFANNLGGLRSLGVIAYPQRGTVAATALLFPEGLR